MGSTEEPERKRRHLNNNNNNNAHSVSPPLKKQQPLTPSCDEKKVDAAMLQYQNQKLAQQLDVQRTEISVLEGKCNSLRSKQASYDDTLVTINRIWNQLVDDLELLAVRANAASNGIRIPEPASLTNDRVNAAGPPEETFLRRLLDRGATETRTIKESNSVEMGLASRKSSTIKTMKMLVQAIDIQRAKNEELAASLRGVLSADVAGQLLQKTDEELRSEMKRLRTVMDSLHLSHKEIAAEAGSFKDCHAKDQAEIMRLSGELEEASAELETSRRKLAALRSQKEDMFVGPPTPGAMQPGVKFEFGDGIAGPEKASREARELEASLEEAKTLADRRLSELQEALQIQLNQSQELQHMQDLLDDEQRVLASQPYQLLNDQVQYLRSEVERYEGLVDQMQADRDAVLRREREMTLKAEASEAARRANTLSDAQAAELESKLQLCMSERDALQLRLEEATQASGRKESVAELKVMVATLHKEMSMMQLQLNKYKEAACAVHSLRAEIQSTAAALDRKAMECKNLSEQCAIQVMELSRVKDEVGGLRESEQELTLILDMLIRESPDSRDVMELQQAECRARAQVDHLKLALDEHSLELRVKAANEAEAVCQQRLTAAEAEIADLRQRLDVLDRVDMELRESLKAKSEEGDAFIAEIEVIGQAYEDMQTQNQRLLQQITERDDFNTQLVSESLKAKQLQTSLLAEKQVLASRMQHANAAADMHKQRVSRLEDQARSLIEQLGKAMDESRQYASALEMTKRKTVETEKELLSMKSALDAAHKGLDDRNHRLADAQADLEKERFEKRRVQEELEVLNSKVTRLHSHRDGGLMVERLQGEIKEYKAILKCSVCHDRPKEVVITKCYHLFCGPCIQRNLDLRHRKCPGCGVPFGQNDVRNVYI
ncbi:hypothetical protein CY35_08G068200 [Sphagnum magellanicum]|nr:hypothetical protein CY35_08G068200 [Sphagnum magellanicum]KAH9554528.1 hypothetical protein CY35_08G068200 [Sphagnum magellanicum]